MHTALYCAVRWVLINLCTYVPPIGVTREELRELKNCVLLIRHSVFCVVSVYRTLAYVAVTTV